MYAHHRLVGATINRRGVLGFWITNNKKAKSVGILNEKASPVPWFWVSFAMSQTKTLKLLNSVRVAR